MTGAAEWRSRVGDTWAAQWRRTERAFAGIGRVLDDVLAQVAPHAGCALDIGCGAGSTTLALAAARPALEVTGADLSHALLSVAQGRKEGRANVRFVLADAVDAAAEAAPLDLLVSRHGMMFFADPPAALAALRRAAAPAAPLVFTCFRARADNDWSAAIEAAAGIVAPPAAAYAPGPYAFADPDWTGALLRDAGWRAPRARAIDVPWVVGAGADPVEDALGFFTHIGTVARVLAEADPVTRGRLQDRLRKLLASRCRDGRVVFTAAAWLWTAQAGPGEA